MKRAFFIVIQATITLCLTSCIVRVPYTTAIQDKYHLSVGEIKQIQFYLSHPIVLYSASDDGLASSKDGKLIVQSDRQLDEIVLRAGTPGVVEEVYRDRLVVSFEIGEGRKLVFGNRFDDSPYYLMAEEWERQHGKMEYAGRIYYAKPGSGAAYLEMKMKKLRQLEKKTRIANGRRL